MKLMTKALEKKLPALYTNESTPTMELIAYVKYFNPMGRGTWYGIEYDPKDRLFFGYDGIYNVLEATARAFKKTDEAFDKEQYINYALKMMTFDICPIYNEAVLPDEDGNCSLCSMHLA